MSHWSLWLEKVAVSNARRCLVRERTLVCIDTVHASGSLHAMSKMQVHFYFLVHINRGTGLLVTELVSLQNSIISDTRIYIYKYGLMQTIE